MGTQTATVYPLAPTTDASIADVALPMQSSGEGNPPLTRHAPPHERGGTCHLSDDS